MRALARIDCPGEWWSAPGFIQPIRRRQPLPRDDMQTGADRLDAVAAESPGAMKPW